MRVDDAPSLDDLAELAEAALAEIPEEFRRQIKGVGCGSKTCRTRRRCGSCGSPTAGLLGLYRGLPIGFKQAVTAVQHVDMIISTGNRSSLIGEPRRRPAGPCAPRPGP